MYSNEMLTLDFVFQRLQENLSEMETELRSIRQAAQNQERTIQSLTESLNTKETEVLAYICARPRAHKQRQRSCMLCKYMYVSIQNY